MVAAYGFVVIFHILKELYTIVLFGSLLEIMHGVLKNYMSNKLI